MSTPLVSIIIPNYNKELYIKDAIDSALNQTYKNIEVIVVDDGSTDSSKEIIKSYGKRIKAYFLPHKNANVARNFGFKKSKGKYIQFLDSDDVILPQKIEEQVKLLDETKSDFVLCYWQHFYDDGKREKVQMVPVSMRRRDLFLWLLEGNWFPSHVPVYSRSFIKTTSPWDESLLRAQDSDFHYQCALNYPKINTVKEVLALYRKTDTIKKYSKDYTRLWVMETYKVYNKALPFIINKEEKELFARRVYKIARAVYDIDYNLYKVISDFAFSICKDFIPDESKLFNFSYKILGRNITEFLASIKRRFV